MPNVGAISAFVLLALASGFLFAYRWERTRYLSLRSEGQQLYLLAAVYAIPLIIAARILLWMLSLWAAVCEMYKLTFLHSFVVPLPRGYEVYLVVPTSCPEPVVGLAEKAWRDIAGPLYAPALLTFFVAFLLAWLSPGLLNARSDRNEVAGEVIMRYGSQLEQFFYETITHKLPVSVSLDNRKVYVGYAWRLPPLDPRRIEDYAVRLLPLRSGYRDEHTLELHFTTNYSRIYEQIRKGQMVGSVEDFVIVLPVKNIISVNLYALQINPSLLRMPLTPEPRFESPPARARDAE